MPQRFYPAVLERPEPTSFERIEIPKGCNPITLVALGFDSARSVGAGEYLPSKELARARRSTRRRARSEPFYYFGFAANLALRIFNPRATMSVKGRMLQFGEDKMARFVSGSGLGPPKRRPKA
jgi:hypothetical protein